MTHASVEATRTAREIRTLWEYKGYEVFNPAAKWVPTLRNLLHVANGGDELNKYLVSVDACLVVADNRDGYVTVSRWFIPSWMVMLASSAQDNQAFTYEQFYTAFKHGLNGETEQLEAFIAIVELHRDAKRGQ